MEEGKITTNKFMTVKQLADKLQLSEATIYKHWRSLGGVRVGGSIRFDLQRTLEHLQQESEEGASPVSPGHSRLMKPPRDRRRKKTVFELDPDRHGLLDPDPKVIRLNAREKGGESA